MSYSYCSAIRIRRIHTKYTCMIAYVSFPAGDPECIVCSDPLGVGYDGLAFMILGGQKTSLSGIGTNSTNPCRFLVRGVTSLDISGVASPLWLDWIAVNFHVKDNFYAGHLRSWIFGQTLDKFMERGDVPVFITCFFALVHSQ